MIPLKDENPTETFPLCTVLLIAANVGVYVYELSLGPPLFEPLVHRMAVIPSEIAHGPFLNRYPTIFTSMFLHSLNPLHVIGNMLYLWIFGNNVEDAMGHVRFVVFYLLCGIAASLTHIVLNASSEVPVIGASGAISGVLGAYLILYPRARVLVLVPIMFFIRVVSVPAFFMLGLWIVFQILQGIPSLIVSEAAGGVAWFAHVGGFVAGIVLLPVFKRARRIRRFLDT